MAELPITPEASRSESVRAQIQAWLMEEGWNVGQGSAPDAEWFLTATDSLGRRIGVGKRVKKPDQIVIQGSVTVNDEHQRQLKSLPSKELDEFLWDLRFRLLASDVEFSGVQDPLSRVEIAQRIYYDALSKDTFLQRISKVRNGVLVVLWSVARKLTSAV